MKNPPSCLDSPAPMRDDDAMTDSPLDSLAASIDALDAMTDDSASLAIRDMIITDSFDDIRALSADYDIPPALLLPIRDAIQFLIRDDLSALCLSFSICPIHYCDYAICFDDNPADCLAIRTAFPAHDS